MFKFKNFYLVYLLVLCLIIPAFTKTHVILLLGDSVLDPWGRTVHVRLLEYMNAAMPTDSFIVNNQSLGGECLGPADLQCSDVLYKLFTTYTSGRYFTTFKPWYAYYNTRGLTVDYIICEHGINDSRAYAPDSFSARLDTLTRNLSTDFPQCKIVISTSMVTDPPTHAEATYNPGTGCLWVPGFNTSSNRNVYLDYYYSIKRTFAASKGYLLADVAQQLTDTITAHNHTDNFWEGYNDIHPDSLGCAFVARVYRDALLADMTGPTSVKGNNRIAENLVTLSVRSFPNSIYKFAITNQSGHPVDIALYSIAGTKVKSLACGANSGSTYSLIWNGKDESGRITAPGIYFVKVTNGKEGSMARFIKL